MQRFARLYAELDASTATHDKVAALKRYFADAEEADAAWAVYFLAGGKPRQTVPTALLRATACEVAGIADWLFEECYQAVGDLAETIAHVLPTAPREDEVGLAVWIEERLLPLRGEPPEQQARALAQWWMALSPAGRFLLTKLIGGGFRVGVSKLLVQRALAEHAGLDAKIVAQRMMGYTDAKAVPSARRYAELVSRAGGEREAGQPYPFFLAHQLDVALEAFAAKLGEPQHWLVEWKYDGIRAQIVKRAGRVWIWSRGEELVTERFPEVVALAQPLPNGTVLDGELLVWQDNRPAPFNLLQQRIGRKTLTKKVLADAPVSFVAYDLLEWEGVDWRERAQHERRAQLEALLPPPGRGAKAGFREAKLLAAAAARPCEAEPSSGEGVERPDVLSAPAAAPPSQPSPSKGEGVRLLLSPRVDAPDWPAFAALREQSRGRGVEGFMLKHRDAAYGTGRTKADGTWWKWKIDPMSVDCVLIYAQAGHGRRASVYTDYTFAVWNRTPRDAAEAQAVVDAIERREPAAEDGLQLVPFAKAYSGLTDEEFRAVDREIRARTLEKFGPVRSVKPTLVFELGFEGINRSARHKSGIAVRFPRMLRIRHDKPLHEADSLPTLERLLSAP